MYTYLVVNGVFLLASIVLLLLLKAKLPAKSIIITIIGLIVLTALFDNILIGTDIVHYNQSHTLNVYIGRIPIEDFAYPVVAAVIVASLWERNKK